MHSLIALMEFQSSRFAARVDARGPADHARRAGPSALGPLGHRTRARRPGAGGDVRPRARVLRPAGSRRGVPRGRPDVRRHRLAAHRPPLRRARDPRALARRAAQPRGRRLDGRRSRRGARDRRRARRRARRASARCTRCAPNCSSRLGEPDAAAAAFLAAAELPGNEAEATVLPRPRRELARRAAGSEPRRSRSRPSHRGCGSDPGCWRNLC